MTEPVHADARLGSGAMFDRIAGRYDFVNRVISLGIDERWRKRTVDALNIKPGARILDLATGTGDLAIRIALREPSVRVDGVDPSGAMLAIAREKTQARDLGSRTTFTVGIAEALPFPDDTFDGATIAFGIRNVPDRLAGLKEMARVTKSGGRVCVLELSEPAGGVLGPFARFHIRKVVPRLGALLSGEKEYRYLEQSVRAFPSPKDFGALMESAGLRVLEIRPFTFGVCCLYVAEVP
jgi:demethylmenaquinone methyltransferase/2-methoxy-6-polyprenyl-1,4-benzoquinol methylase